MRLGILLISAMMLLGTASTSFAEAIQCKRILSYLSTGRSPSDVAETMVISEDEVLACQVEAVAAKGEGEAGEDAAGEPAEE
jgi:uncharacterized Ntn-hydrolase superfamily protein